MAFSSRCACSIESDGDAVLRQRIHQPRALTVFQLADVVDRETARGGRRSQQAASEARAFFVGPVHELHRHRRWRRGVKPQRLERRRDAQRAVEPAAVGHRIEMAADDHGLRRGAGQRHPVVAGRIGLDVQAELRDLAGEPGARIAPDRSPGEALGAVGIRGPRGELAQIGDDALGAGHERRTVEHRRSRRFESTRDRRVVAICPRACGSRDRVLRDATDVSSRGECYDRACRP